MHPVLFHIGNFAVHTYGALVALGFVVGLTLAARRAKQAGVNPDIISNLGVWVIVAGMLGGKLFHVIFFWNEFVAGWRAAGLASLREGFVFYGGFIAASATVIGYCRYHRLPTWTVADVFAPCVALGHALGRLGCFFNGCCYGKTCDLPWAVRFPPPHEMAGLPVHPTQLYEVAGNLALFGGLSWWRPREKFPGQVWWGYVLGYGVLRFAVEFSRGDYPYRFGPFTLGHAVAAALIVVAAIALKKRS